MATKFTIHINPEDMPKRQNPAALPAMQRKAWTEEDRKKYKRHKKFRKELTEE